MSAHLAHDVLSAYLDEELVHRDSRRVETHISECQQCRQRLDGLRRVVAKLHRVEATAVPDFFSDQLQHRISLAARPTGLADRLDSRLQRLLLPKSTIPLLFALVMVLVMTVYSFFWAVHRYQRNRASVVVAPESIDGGLLARQELGGRVFVLENGKWREAALGQDQVGRPIESSSLEGQRLLTAEPDLAVLLDSGEGVLFRWEGDVVRLFRAAE